MTTCAMKPEELEAVDLTGKVAIVTGGARGIGFETVYLLASKGAVVYIAGRNQTAVKAAIEALRPRLPEGIADRNLRPLSLDLSTMSEASLGAQNFLQEHPDTRLDIVIANAGISLDPGKKLSPDGFEQMFATNHLGHFVFINTLLPAIEKAAKEHGDARIVVVASDAHKFAPKGIDYDMLKTLPDAKGRLGPLKASFQRYGQSKLANMLYTMELGRRLREKGVKGVYVNCLHPGAILETGLGGNGEEFGVPPMITKAVRGLGKLGVGCDAQKGAMTQVLLATSPQIREKDLSGRFFDPAVTFTWKYQHSKLAEPYTEIAKSSDAAKELWEYTERAVKEAGVAGTEV